MQVNEELFKHLKNKGFSERWFFLASVQNLLLYVINGFSNKHVAAMVGLDEEYISLACETFLGFSGWEEELNYSPWYRYKHPEDAITINSLTKEKESDIIKRYIEYRKELDDFYDRDEVA